LGERCTATVVDVASMEAIAELPLPGPPRWALYDDERDCVHTNIRDPAQLISIDAERVIIERTIDVPSDGPHGLWLDSGRLFCAADGGQLIILDGDSGAVLTSLELPGAPDVVMHDADLQRLYVAIGEPGVVASFDTERLEHIDTVETETGAHTSGWDPVARRLYVFCPDSSGALVFEERA
jgi:hypothetical protein